MVIRRLRAAAADDWADQATVTRRKWLTQVELAARLGTVPDVLNRALRKLEEEGLVKNHLFQPKGHSYYLRQKNPVVRNGNAFIIGDAVGLATLDMGEGIRSAIKSGMIAADAIVNNKDYSLSSIPRFSLFSIIGSGSAKKANKQSFYK